MRFAGQLNIGPLQFDLQAAAPLTVCYPERAYAGFFHAKPTASNALRRLPVTVTRGAEPIPTTEPLFRGGRNWAVWDAGDEWQFAAGFHERSVARWMCRLARDFSRASVTVDFTGDVCVGHDLLLGADLPVGREVCQVASAAAGSVDGLDCC